MWHAWDRRRKFIQNFNRKRKYHLGNLGLFHSLLFSLFNDAVSNTDYTASNDWMNELPRVQKRLWPNLKHFLGIYLKGLRRNTKTLIKNTALAKIHTSPHAPQKHCRSVRGERGGVSVMLRRLFF